MSSEQLKDLAAHVLDDATSDNPQGVPLPKGLRAWFEFIDYQDKPRMAIAVRNADGDTLYRYISKSYYRMCDLKKVVPA